MLLFGLVVLTIILLYGIILVKESGSTPTVRFVKSSNGDFLGFFNFKNIGKKIKTFTEIVCKIAIVLCVIAGIVAFVICILIGEIGLALLSVLATVAAVFVAWLSSWSSYAFGELVDSVSEIKELLKNGKQNDV